MLENTEGAIKEGQSRETGNIGHTRRRKTKTQTICVGYHNTQITLIRHAASHKQLEIETNRTSFLCGNHNGHHNTQLIA